MSTPRPRLPALLALLLLSALAQPALSTPLPAAAPESQAGPAPSSSFWKRSLFGFGFGSSTPHQPMRPRPRPGPGVAGGLVAQEQEGYGLFAPQAGHGEGQSGSGSGSGLSLEEEEEEMAYPLCPASVLSSMGYRTLLDAESVGEPDAAAYGQDDAYGDSYAETEDGAPRRTSPGSRPSRPRPGAPHQPRALRPPSASADAPLPLLGFAHYPGFRVLADDISGAVPISPESGCLAACRKYGPACGGVSYDAEEGRCWFKGKRAEVWEFVETGEEEGGVDLAGGCARWKDRVGGQMDRACCRL